MAGSCAILGGPYQERGEEVMDATELFTEFMSTIKDEYEGLDPLMKQRVGNALRNLAELTIASMKGEDVEQDLKVARAVIANYEAAGAVLVAKAFNKLALQVGKIALAAGVAVL